MGLNHGGFAVWLNSFSWVVDGVRVAMLLWILQNCERLLLMVSQSHYWMSVSMPVQNSGRKVVDVLRRMGCCSESVMVWRAYFLQVCCSRMAVGGSDASSSIGIMGEVRKAPRICLEAVFWSFCSLSVYPFCPLHQASVPKSRIGRTQLVHSWRMC